MAKIKPLTISLILGVAIIIINFIAYLSFRFFIAQEAAFLEGLGFTLWDTFLELIVVMPISYILSGGNKK